MMSSRRIGWTLATSLLCAAIACGGLQMGGGIAGTSSVLGAITGFGSIIVGGVEFDTAAATVTIDGSSASVDDLKLGMVAAVRGVVTRDGRAGTAESIVSDALLQGPIDRIDVGASLLVALDQVAIFGAATAFEPSALAALSTGDMVRVSGFLDAGGRVRATRVEAVGDPEVEIKGFVADIDETARRFRINALEIDYSRASLDGAERLANGLFVEVDGDGPPVDGVLAALAIDVLDPVLMADPGDDVKVEGFVTAIRSDTEFVIGAGQRIRVDASTRFENGTREDVALDAAVDASGVAQDDGAMLATEVEFSKR